MRHKRAVYVGIILHGNENDCPRDYKYLVVRADLANDGGSAMLARALE